MAARPAAAYGADGLPVAGAAIDTLVPAMTEVCGADYVITDPPELRTYECDGLTSHRSGAGAGRAAGDRRAGRRGGPGLRRGRASRSSPAGRAPGCPAARWRARTAC